MSMGTEGRGKVYYGLHFYPGVAQYQEPGKDPYRVFLNENTLRSMDPTFAGCPVFVSHVDEVEPDVNELRKEADGWVMQSFYNEADGKHWVKFIIVSDAGEQAIKRGMKLSNCYLPTKMGSGGTWNAIDYSKEILEAEYEHLALVPNPRYEESVILTPEEFKKYNDDHILELKKIANNKEQKPMKFSFFKRSKVENALDLENLCVTLSSGREIELSKLINEADEMDKKKEKGEMQMADGEHHVDVDGNKIKVNELVAKYKDACAAIHSMKDADDSETPAEMNDVDEESQDMDEAKKPVPESDSDAKADKKAMMLETEEEKEVKDAKEEKRQNALAKAEALRNAPFKHKPEIERIEISQDRVARGKSRYGS